MGSLIDQAKQIPASAIAEWHGIALIRRGSRQWACCPFHTEKTASLCFYPDGSWHCFGCGAGGDSVALMAQLMQANMHEAAKRICEAYQPAAAGEVARNAYTWMKQRVKRLRETIKLADEYTGLYSVETAEAAWADPIFRAAIQAKQQANWEIDELYAADKQELELLMVRGCSAGG